MKRFAVVLAAFSVGGCVVASEQPAFDTSLIVSSEIPALPPQKGAAPTVPQLNTPNPCGLTAAEQRTAAERTNCIWRIKSVIDVAYGNYRLHIAKQVGLITEGYDIGSTTGAAAAAATTGIANKVFSGLTASFTGARSAFNSDALYQQSLQAIFKQMDADRANAWATMQIAMQSSSYNMTQAENDLLAYFRAGTIEDAIGTLDANAGSASTTCKAASNAVNAATSNSKTVATPAMSDATGATTSEQCGKILQAANNAMTIVKTKDIADQEAIISKNIKSISNDKKPLLDTIANAINDPANVPVVADFFKERASILSYLRNIDDDAKLSDLTADINTATGKDYTRDFTSGSQP